MIKINLPKKLKLRDKTKLSLSKITKNLNFLKILLTQYKASKNLT